ncbi:MAG: nucleotidyltransferase domain-containing protein [candidate division WOR-3 bacterium]
MSALKEILQKKNKRKKKLESALATMVSQLKKLNALKVILFGSLTEGEVDVTSDLDLLVIMPSNRSGKEWLRLIYENLERDVASDIIVYNQKEFEARLPTCSFLQKIKMGKVIYEKRL